MDQFNDSSISELISLLSSKDQLSIKSENTSDPPNSTTVPLKISGINVILKRLESSEQFDYGKLQNINHSNVARYYYSPLQEKDYLMIEYVDERDIITFIKKLSILKNTKTKQQQDNDMSDECPFEQQSQQYDVNSLSLINRVKIMEQVANAMNYLHSQNIPHLNLKPSHILLNKRGIIKLSGYGLFRLDKVFLNSDKSLRFFAPEVLFKNKELISLKSDVYSFGIIFYELLTGRMAYDGDIDRLPDLLNAGQRPLLNEVPDILGKIISYCWQENPALRPSFQEIQKNLEEIILQSPFDQKKYYNQLIDIAGLSMDMPLVVEAIKSSTDYQIIGPAVTNLVNLLAYPKSKLQFKLYENVCEELSRMDIVPRLIEFLYANDQPSLQFNSACVLSNIISGVHSRVLVDNAALPALLQSCKSSHRDVFVQSCWILGNIGEESCFYHEEMLRIGLLPLIVHQYNTIIQSHDYSSKEVIVWVLSNLVSMFRDKTFPSLEQIAPAIPILVEYIDYQNQEIQLNVLKGVHRLTFGDKRKNAELFRLGFLPKIINILSNHPNEKLVLLSLKILGNFSSDEDRYTIAIHESLERSCYQRFLQHADTDFRVEFGLLLSNLFAVVSIAKNLRDYNLFPILTAIISDKNESIKVKLEILYCLYNAVEMNILDVRPLIPILAPISNIPDLQFVCQKFLSKFQDQDMNLNKQ